MANVRSHFTNSKISKISIPTSSIGAWLTNAGKSIGYSAQDVLTDIMPATMDHAAGAVELMQDFREKLKDYRVIRSKFREQIDKNAYVGIAKDAAKNAVDALKTGKFYEGVKVDDDFDFGDEFDFGDDSFNSDINMDVSSGSGEGVAESEDSDGRPSLTHVSVNMDIGENSPMVASINQQTRISVENNEKSMELSRSNNAMIMDQFMTMDSHVADQFGQLNQNVSTLTTTVSTTLTQHASLSAKYYNDSMEVFNNIFQSLQAIQNTIVVPADTQEQKPYENVLDLFSGNGRLDLGEYKGLIAKNAKKYAQSNMFLSTIMGVLGDTDSIAQLAKNPLKFIPEKIVTSIIGNSLRQTVEEFDKTLSGATVTALHRVRGLVDSDNPILQGIGEIFGIDNKIKSSVDKRNYVRTKVDWDGISRKTLVEVIPYYLRKITSALTGMHEVAYDYEQGSFRKMTDMAKERDKDRMRAMTRSVSDVGSDFNEFIDSKYGVQFKDTKSRRDASDYMDKFLAKLVASSGQRLNWEGGSSLKSIAKLMGTSTDDNNTRLIAAWLDAQSNSYRMGLSQKILESRANFSKYNEDIESGKISSNEMYFNGGETIDDMFRRINGQISDNVDYERSLLGGGQGKYGRTSNQYLRDILETLATGIKVWVIGSNINDRRNNRSSRSRRGSARGQQPQGDNDIFNISRKKLDTIEEGDRKYKEEERRNRENYNRDISPDVIRRGIEGGKYDGDANEYDVTSIRTHAASFRNERDNQDENQSKFADWFNRVTGLRSDSPLSKIINGTARFMSGGPQEIIQKFFKTADNMLFRIVFGGADNEPSIIKTYTKRFMAFIKSSANKLNGILENLHEKIFGDDGIINQIKQSQLGISTKAMMERFKTFLIGNKDAEGNYSGGFISDTANELKNIGHNIKESLIGKNDDSVWSNIKASVGSKIDSAMSAMGFDVDPNREKSKTPIKDTLDTITATVKHRTSAFMDDVFGKDTDRREEFDKIGSELSGKRGKFGAGAVLGMIGSLFSPVGLVGGALIGIGTTAIKESETLQKIMFGSVDAETGEEKAGLINKELVDLYKDNKNGIGFGIAAGTLARIGLLPSFLVPGGPIGGALIGLAGSVVYNSDAFQDFMFGPIGSDGKRVSEEGFAKKIGGAFGGLNKNNFIDAGIGAGVGFLGSFFLPASPLVATILGSATGLALSTDKFKTFLFGDYIDKNDKSKGRDHNGLFGKMYQAAIAPAVDGFKALQIKFAGWLERKILLPVQMAVKPIAYEVKHIRDSIANMFKSVGDYIKEIVIKPIGDTIQTYFINPIKTLTKTIFTGFTKIMGALISAPFKVLQVASYALNRRQMKRGKNAWVDDTLGAALTGRNAANEKVGLGGRLKGLGRYIFGGIRGEYSDARFSEAGAPYGDIKFQTKVAESRSKAWQEYQLKHRKDKDRKNLLTKQQFYDKYAEDRWGEYLNKPQIGRKYKTREEFYKAYGFSDSSLERSRAAQEAANAAKSAADASARAANATEDINSKIKTDNGAVRTIVVNGDRRRGRVVGRTEDGRPIIRVPGISATNDDQPSEDDSRPGLLQRLTSAISNRIEDSEDSINEDSSTPPDNAAFGKQITKLGEYVLSPGEQVIPNASKSQRLKDYASEKAYIATKYGDPNAMENFAFGTGKLGEKFKNFKSKFMEDLHKNIEAEREKEREKDAAKREEDAAKKAAKDKEDQELKDVQNAGSFKERYKKRLEQLHYSEQMSVLDKIRIAVEATSTTAKSYNDEWVKIWGNKKGIITLSLLAFSPLVLKAVSSIAGYISKVAEVIQNLWNKLFNNDDDDDNDDDDGSLMPEWVSSAISDIKESFNTAVGGTFSGVKNHAAAVGTRELNGLTEIFNPSSDKGIVDRVVNWVAPYNEETGRYEENSLSRPKGRLFSKVIGGVTKSLTGRKVINKTLTEEAFNDMVLNAYDDAVKKLPHEKVMATFAEGGEEALQKLYIETGNKAAQKVSSKYGPKVGQEVSEVLQSRLGKFATSVVRNGGRMFTGGASTIGKGIASLNKASWDVISTAGKATLNAGKTALGAGKKAVSTAFDINIKKPFEAISKFAPDNVITTAVNSVKSTGKNVATAMATPFKNANNKILTNISNKAISQIPQETITNTLAEGGEEALQKLFKETGEQAVSGGLSGIAKNAVGEAKTTLVSGSKGIVKTVAGWIDNIIKFLSSKLPITGVKNFASSVKGGLNVAFKKVGGWDAAIKKSTTQLSEKILASRVGGTKVGKALASAASFGLADVVFAGVGLIDGATSAANLFQVNDEYVDGKMRVISAAFRALLNTTFATPIDILNEVLYSITGVNFVGELARILYNIIATDEESAALDAGRTKFREEYTENTKTEYETWIQSDEGKKAIQRGEYSGNWEQDSQKFTESGKATSFSDYNTKQHKTLTTTITTGVSNFAKGIADKSARKNVFSADYWKIDPDLSEEEAGQARMKQFMMIPYHLVQGALGSVFDFFKDTLSGITNAGKGVFTGITEVFTKIHGIGDVFSKEYWKTPASEGESDLASSFSSIGSYITKFVLFLPSVVYGGAQSVLSGIGKIFKGISTFTGKMSQASNFSLMNVHSLKDVFNKDYWTPPSDEEGNPMSPVSRGAFYGMRALSFLPAVACGVAGDIGRLFKPVTDWVSKTIASITGLDLDDDTGAPVDDEGNPMSGVALAGYYGAKALQIPVKMITWVGSTVGKYIGPIASKVGGLLGAVFTDIVTAAEVTDDPLIVFKKKYWTMNDTDYDKSEIGPLRHIGFIGSRLALMVPMTVLGLVKSAFGTLTDLVQNPEIATEFSPIKLFTDTEVSEYWKLPTKYTRDDGSNIFTGLNKFLFYIERLAFAIPYYVYKGISAIGTGIGAAVKWVKDKLGIEDISAEEAQANRDAVNDQIGSASRYGSRGNRSGSGNGKGVQMALPGGNGGDTLNGFPYYSQNDPSVKNQEYKYSANGKNASSAETMGNRGCGPTAMAMVNDALNGNSNTPSKMAKLATEQGYSTTAGTTPGYFTSVGSQLGMNVIETGATSDNIRGMLNSGQPVIIQGQSSRPNSPFTPSGHYVVAVGMDGNNRVIINDPRGKSYSGSYSMNNILNGSHVAWGFSKGGYGFGGNGNGEVTEQAQAVVNTASKYLGYKEKASNKSLDDSSANAGNSNYTYFAREYGKYAGGSWNPSDWCAMFVSVVFVETFGLEEAKKLLCGKLFASCRLGKESFESKGQFVKEDPQVGDVVFFSKDGGSKPCHVGIVTGFDDENVYTIEGNTSDPTNSSGVEGVYAKTRSRGQTRRGLFILGYGRPSYSGATVISNNTTSNDSATSAGANFTNIAGLLGGAASAYMTPISSALFGEDSGVTSILGLLGNAAVNPITTSLYGTTADTSAPNSDAPATTSSELTGNSDAEKIWNYLIDAGYTKAGAAGIMGNLTAESGMRSNNLQDTFEKKFGLNDSQYTAQVNNKTINKNKFSNDSAGYGIAQWTYPSRKQRLYENTIERGLDVSDLSAQLNFLDTELREMGLKDELSKTTNVKSASNLVLDKYENPRTKPYSKRNGYSNEVYSTYAGNGDGTTISDTRYVRKPSHVTPDKPATNYRKNDVNRYNVMTQRGGNGSNVYTDEDVVKLLSLMLTELQGANTGINKFNDKEFSVKSSPVIISDSSTKNNVTVQESAPKKATQKEQSFVTPENYSLAKRIASGNVSWPK